MVRARPSGTIFFILLLHVAALRPTVDEATQWPKEGMAMYFTYGERYEGLVEKPLSEDGEKQVVDRIKLIHDQQYHSVWQTLEQLHEVWVAPNRGAMATAIILLMAVHGSDSGDIMGEPLSPFPPVKVHRGLRTFGSMSVELTGETSDLRGYLTDVAERYGRRYFSNEHVMKQLVDELLDSYDRAASDTAGWTTNKPKGAPGVYRNVHTVKQSLHEVDGGVLMIGSASLAHYMFMVHLPSGMREDGPWWQEENLKSMWRASVATLAPASGLRATWKEVTISSGSGVEALPTDPTLSYPYFTQIDFVADDTHHPVGGKTRGVPFDSRAFALDEARGLLPNHGNWYSVLATKKKWKWIKWTKPKVRLITVSYAKGFGVRPQGHISWLDPWGEEVRGWVTIVAIQWEPVTDAHGSIKIKSSASGSKGTWIVDTGDRNRNIELMGKLREAFNACTGT
mmetsp:Transcript_65238/g.121614  ORF Transcript_65238/g.121614 Transcript_65238/m.121614 type:complete len:453 (+) Transcript_65238:115-1473(+)